MGISYPVVMAIVISGCIMITLFILYSGLLPYVNVLTRTGSFVIEYYYISSSDNSMYIVIKNTGALGIEQVNVTVSESYNGNIIKIINVTCNLGGLYIIRTGDSVSIECILKSGTWKCSAYPSISSSSVPCNVTAATNAEFVPGVPYYINVLVKFVNSVTKIASLKVIPIS